MAHHQTLRATIDWSYQLLAEPEQRLLARLAVFAGGCTLEAAETVCGGDGIDPDTVFELLASLVARSLVVAEEHGPETRYRLLETIRQYGEERLDEAGETDRWQARHADYYAGVLAANPDIPRPARGGVLGGAAQRRTRQPARRLVLGDRHPQYRHRVFDPGRLRAERGLVQVAPAAGRRGGPGAARRGRAPGLPARPRGQRQCSRPIAGM